MGASFSSHMLRLRFLDPKHTVFGQVTKGQDIVDSVKQGDKINSVTITEA